MELFINYREALFHVMLTFCFPKHLNSYYNFVPLFKNLNSIVIFYVKMGKDFALFRMET